MDAAAPPRMNTLHWTMLQKCYARNFRELPALYWDSQKAVGQPFARRAIMQTLGRSQILFWKAILAWRKWGAEKC